VSYDGMGEPLGRSQVLTYLFRLAVQFDVALVSFEKPDADRAALHAELASHGIDWHPLRYHKRPPVLSTILARADIVHVRSYVPALIAMLGRPATGGRFLFDIRGFWPEERVEGGIWPADGVIFRIAKRCERWFFRSADAVVTLTQASVPRIRGIMGDSAAPVRVVPTCAELSRFGQTAARPTGSRVLWCGSIGTWYRFDLAAPLALALGMELEVLTRQTDLARQVLAGHPANVRTLAPADVPSEMCARDVGLSLCKNVPAMQAMAPTRFAEYMAAGMAVIVTEGLGDVERLVVEHRVGVVLRSEGEAGFAEAAQELAALLADPGLVDRCRALARERFDVETGAAAYAQLYRDLLDAAS
jgi:hypothetical protein